MSAEPPNVLGLCGYDFRNVGDDAFMAVLAEQMLRITPSPQVRLTSGYAPEGCRCERVVPIYRGMGRWRGAPLARLLKHGTNLDALVLCGGSVLHEGCHFDREALKLRALRMLNPGLRTAVLGVSIGPLHSSRQIRRLVGYLNRFDYVSVRDEPSWQFLQSQPMRVAVERHFDLAALLLDEAHADLRSASPRTTRTTRARSARDEGVTIGLAPCHVQRYRGGDPTVDNVRCEKIAEALRLLSRRYRLRVRFFEFNGHDVQGDQAAIEAISRGLGEAESEVVRYRPNPRDFLDEVGRCDALIAMRLHSAVFAFLKNTALVSLAYHPKCVGFSQDIGLPARRLLDADDFGPEDLAKAVEAALAGGETPTLCVEEAIASARRHWSGALRAWAWPEPCRDPRTTFASAMEG